ncbi:MAG TPA: thiamine pyrophosphate-binding protein [Usitatibacter sp.]|jgi:acetolactate synthase-1/2/3 large subunit|nr:thiamine pyrophosphate-binding protein [Usitatibacter sp.]
MSAPKRRGADALARTLRRSGVRRIFTLSGNHVMPVFDAALDAGLDLVHVRHEAAAVHMADAWARLTGEVGVALVTGGPGHANAVGALYTAAMAEAPVLLLSGHAPLAQLGRGAFQEMRQAEIAVPLTKAAGTAQRADTLAREVVQAMALAASGRAGPVHVSLPQDVLEAGAPDDDAAYAARPAPAATFDAAAFLAPMQRARRPLILCGPSCMSHEGRARMRALEEASGIPVVGMESPRGIADPALGAFAQLLATADRVLLLGKRLDFTLRFGAPPAFDAACEFLQLDPETAEIERTARAVGNRIVASAVADIRASLEALTRAARVAESGWLGEVRDAIAFRPAAWDGARASQPGRLHPVQALRPLQALLDAHPRSVFIADGGEFGQWAQACLDAPHRVINGMAGSIGAGLPFALAARLAQPEAPVIAALGDGTFGFHCAEIDTAVRYGLPFVAVVGNDARWNAEYQIQLRDYGAGRLVGCELLPARYERVAQGFGAHGESVTDGASLLPAAQRAMASSRPAVLNVMIEGLAAPDVRR